MASKNRNLHREEWKYILLEGRWSDRAASNRRRFEELNVGVLTLGYSNIVNLLVEISILKHAKYTKTVTSKCEIVI